MPCTRRASAQKNKNERRCRVKYSPVVPVRQAARFTGTAMSAPAPHTPADPSVPHDMVEDIVPLMPIVLPIVGGVLMFLLAFIAVTMA